MDYLDIAKNWAPFVTILGVVITVLYRLNKGVDGKIKEAINTHKEEITETKKLEAENLNLRLENLDGKMKGRLNAVAKINSLVAGQVKTLHETQVFKKADEDNDFS